MSLKPDVRFPFICLFGFSIFCFPLVALVLFVVFGFSDFFLLDSFRYSVEALRTFLDTVVAL